jgi:hypothetical protein
MLGLVDNTTAGMENEIALLQPVDTVASGNLHSVTSNAVFDNCVIKRDVTIQTPSTIENDIKTLANELLSLITSGTQTFSGFLLRSGATSGSYTLTVRYNTSVINGYVVIGNEQANAEMYFVTRLSNDWVIRPMIRAINSMGKSEIANRVTDGIISFNFFNELNSGMSIDVVYDTGYIIVYKVVNGVTVGTKSCILS